MPNEQDPEFNMKMEETMKDSAEVPGLDEINFDDKENHPLALFIMTQTLYTQNNQDGFKTSLQQFMQSIQLHTTALATGQLNPENVDSFMQKLELLGEVDIQRFKERLNPTEKIQLTEVEEILEIEEEVITIVVDQDAKNETEADESPEKIEVVLITDSQAENEAKQETQEDSQEEVEAGETAKDEEEAVIVPVEIEVEAPEKADEETNE